MEHFTFADLLQKTPVFRALNDALHLSSPIGKKLLQQQIFTCDSTTLQNIFYDLEQVIAWHQKNSHFDIEKLKRTLATVLDLHLTVQRLENGDILDELELFELKKNGLAFEQIGEMLTAMQFPLFSLPSVEGMVNMLNPEEIRMPHFHIYEGYHPRLAPLRKAINATCNHEEEVALQQELLQVEQLVLQTLSEQLAPFSHTLQACAARVASLDLLIAKAELALKWECTIPHISHTNSSYTGLVHPLVRQNLPTGSTFQPIDIALENTTYLITGANMAGKTVLLKSLAWAQTMFQFGFAVAAHSATITPVEEIYFSAEELHTEFSGLSSFAAEILSVNHFLQEAKKGRKLLILIDELARTTNPEEGTALVTAYCEMMRKYATNCVITSHYTSKNTKCKKLRIKGLQIKDGEKIALKELSKHIDYQPIETEESEVPLEALRIAKVFEVDLELLAMANSFLVSDNK